MCFMVMCVLDGLEVKGLIECCKMEVDGCEIVIFLMWEVVKIGVVLNEVSGVVIVRLKCVLGSIEFIDMVMKICGVCFILI